MKTENMKEKKFPSRVSVYLSSLEEPLKEYCEKTGESPSQVIRKAIAKLLKVSVPVVEMGNPILLEHVRNKAKKA